jgi:RNA polymerase sigma factor (sigma-70 family)
MKTIKSKNASEAYQNWRSQFFSDGSEDHDFSLGLELAKAEPDLLPYIEPDLSDELEAALLVLNSGGLTKLTAIQQKVFQLSVVEGMSNREVAKSLHINESGVRQHVELIGKKLKALAEKHL